jgi:nitrile hydratase accessory protein
LADSAVAGTEGLPRRNGELVFDEPWEARAFGLAVVVCRQQGLDWEAFRSRLIAEIEAWEREPDGDWSYYERWLVALEGLLGDLDLVGRAELAVRADRVAHEVAHEHDHGHEHDSHHRHHDDRKETSHR